MLYSKKVISVYENLWIEGGRGDLGGEWSGVQQLMTVFFISWLECYPSTYAKKATNFPTIRI